MMIMKLLGEKQRVAIQLTETAAGNIHENPTTLPRD